MNGSWGNGILSFGHFNDLLGIIANLSLIDYLFGLYLYQYNCKTKSISPK